MTDPNGHDNIYVTTLDNSHDNNILDNTVMMIVIRVRLLTTMTGYYDASGSLPRLPDTAVEVYGQMIDQSKRSTVVVTPS